MPRLQQAPAFAAAHETCSDSAGPSRVCLSRPAAARSRRPAATQAVVFLLQHGPAGSLGLLLNRPTSLSMRRGRGGIPLPVEVRQRSASQLCCRERACGCSAIGGGRLRQAARAAGGMRGAGKWSRRAPAALTPAPLLPPLPSCLPQGMEQLRDVFADSRVYCGGFRAQHVSSMHGLDGRGRAGSGACCAGRG